MDKCVECGRRHGTAGSLHACKQMYEYFHTCSDLDPVLAARRTKKCTLERFGMTQKTPMMRNADKPSRSAKRLISHLELWPNTRP